MNPLVRKMRRLRSLVAEEGVRIALEVTAQSLRNSVVYRLQQAGCRFRPSARPGAGSMPDNDRYGTAGFLPSSAGRSPDVRAGSVAVIIPVYRGIATTRDCLESVLSAPSPAVGEVIVIDDASPEALITRYLDELSLAGRVRLVRHAGNRGFVASVNRGITEAGHRDVILLNSDTIVANDWADRIASHAHGVRVGTITPFSNNATICSYPAPAGASQLGWGETVASVDAAFAAANLGRSCELPTAVGFCMFISRACLSDVGSFDEGTFGRGYGEENDFCLRAAERGWRHLLAADTYVWHAGEVSFGDAARQLQDSAMETLQGLYPSYAASVARHVERDTARPWRVAATAARFRSGSRPVVLVLLHAYGTGTEHHVLELCRRFRDEVQFLVLRTSFAGPIRLWSPDPSEGLDVWWRTADDLDDLVSFVASFGVRRLHIHHTLGLPFDVHAFVDALGVPFDFTVHDYFAICPRVRLATPSSRFCGGPESARCEACLATPPHVAVASKDQWHVRNGWLLSEAQRVICPSHDTAARVEQFAHGGQLVVAPHDTLDHAVFPPPRPPALKVGDPLRVALIGVLSESKGARTVAECLRRLDGDESAPEFVLIGYVEPESVRLMRGRALRMTGRYDADELPSLLAEVRPHVVWFPATWPETYSYTLSEAMTAGLPVIAPDIGAFAERLKARQWSWIVPWDATPEECVTVLKGVRAALERGEWDGPSLLPRSVRVAASPSSSAAVEPGFYDEEYLRPLSWNREAEGAQR